MDSAPHLSVMVPVGNKSDQRTEIMLTDAQGSRRLAVVRQIGGQVMIGFEGRDVVPVEKLREMIDRAYEMESE